MAPLWPLQNFVAVTILLVVMAMVIQFSGGKPGGGYHPPSLENGVVRPGEID